MVSGLETGMGPRLIPPRPNVFFSENKIHLQFVTTENDRLYSLDLSDNRLNGSIPTIVGDYMNMFLLNLSNKKFGQNIPKEIGRITHLSVLDLSHNLLDGEIPAQLASLLDLSNLNLSHNGLSGHISYYESTSTSLCFSWCSRYV
ncbi:hypothetical protein RND71_003571 [Anisodus tanguticus]|uniref:Uncharacterized protein n=1 Tax=Anisodus tanguticus TaxID=243964 RepID=A0AAE1VX55_9SOLA|nr:hypothetical protein RND71_003571 [Anisodus tanguticus]